MAELKIELGAADMQKVKRFAVLHYGDQGDTSIGSFVETALEMRLLWLDRVSGAGIQVEEPVANWEFKSGPSDERIQSEIRRELFGGRE